MRPRRAFLAWSGWLAAAALLAVWLGGPSGATTSPGGLPERTASIAAASAVASAATSWVRDSLMAADLAVTRIAWAPSTDSTALGAGGDVVWSTRAQRGVMRLIGLKTNDARRWQYQLWIFDKSRDQRYPVDGGVFNVPAGVTEVFVPINARVPVGDAVMFAVTVEAPGGVVVSTRERVALLAAL
ncbi:anti-sigma factor domain-containing protein [Gemmatimonas sp.]|uniref:anti-sigma factor domain-containing protein n=1 Tax=Gemmatimonas sp. TaxID=1962908 RepID=UPI00398384C8